MTLGLSSMKIGALDRPRHGHPDFAPVLGADPAGLQALPVDLGLGGEEALGQLEVTHLEGEEECRPLRLHSDVGQHPEREARLPHAGAGAHDVQRGGLEAQEDPVQLVVAGGHTGDVRAALPQLLDAVQPGPQQLVQGPHAVDRAALADVEDHLLRLVDCRLDVLGHRVADVGDVPRHPDELAQQRVLLDDVGVVARVGDRRRVGQQRDEDGAVADRLEYARALQLVGHRHRVDGLAPLHERLDGAEDVAVRRLVEVGRRALLDADRCRVVGEEHGPEQRLLGLDVVRRHPRTARHRGGGRPQRAGAGVVKGLDHGSLTLPLRVWGT